MSTAWTHDELLAAHAAGTLPTPLALIVATHLALCPVARRRYGAYEALGGALLEGIEPVPLAGTAWTRLMGRLDDADIEEVPAREPVAAAAHGLPRPLRDHLPVSLDELPWRNLGTATEAELRLATPGYKASLIRVKAGKAVPQHTHEGNEATLVLTGSFHDGIGRYRRGDLALADGSLDHRPTADPGQDCLCLSVTDAPLRLTGYFGRLLNPFLRL